ncbi:MAG: creatininase family protein [Promethearchaeota archaeon]
MLLEEMSWDDVEEQLKTVKTIIVPFGSCEAHGFHAPLFTDTKIAFEVAKKVAEELNTFVAPSISYGLCRTTREFSGTLSLSFESLKIMTYDLLKELGETGFEKIVLFTGHCGKSQLVALREAGFLYTKEVGKSNIFLVSAADLVDDLVKELTESPLYHADEVETSLMLFLTPSLIKMDKAVKEFPKIPKYLIKTTGKPWMKSSVLGDATKATREKGEKIFNILVENLIKIIETF